MSAACAGINSVVFYSTPLFVSLGLGQDAAFLSSIITGVVFVATTVVAVLTVDKFGRKVLLPFLSQCYLAAGHCAHQRPRC